MKKTLLILALLAVGITAYGYLAYDTGEFVPEIRTVQVVEGDILDAVVATGALEAVTTVNVGSQVSGIIQDLRVDYNSIVRRGDVIMRLDPSLFETQVEQARANLIRAEADVERLRVSLDDAGVQLSRLKDLAERELISATELEAAQVEERLAEAQLKSAEAAVTQAAASLNQEEVNLEHTVIRAPIDGIVISRLVDAGQTVAASLQAPELFVIAADLAKMRVIANIDESDVGRVRPNQRVTFTVDAFPGDVFEGTVSQIRLEPIVTQNVVTYATVVDAPNPDLRLKPGMTATITLEVARRENVLRIPASALRFRPTPAMFAALNQRVPESLQLGNSPRPFSAPGGGGDPRGPGPAAGAGPRDVTANPGFGGSGAPDPERRRRIRERLAQMSPEEREAFRERRLAARGGAPRGSGAQPGARAPRGEGAPSNTPRVPTVERGATTFDALFGELPEAESAGLVWILQGDRLEGVPVRLGVTDGTASELLDSGGSAASLSAGVDLVIGVSTPDDDQAFGPRSGSPLLPFSRRRRR